jgi:Transposase DDE domain
MTKVSKSVEKKVQSQAKAKKGKGVKGKKAKKVEDARIKQSRKEKSVEQKTKLVRIDNQPTGAKDKYRVKNWASYNAGLKKRGDVTIWFDEDSLQDWYVKEEERKPGGVMIYSDTCIECLLQLRYVFSLALRQTEGFGNSLVKMLGLDLQVPSYTQICRRSKSINTSNLSKAKKRLMEGGGCHIVIDSTGLKVYGEGEWKVRAHGVGKRRTWKKLHIGADEHSNEIYGVTLTDAGVADSHQVKSIIEQTKVPIDKASFDGAYDTVDVYDMLEEKGIKAIIPPRENALIWTDEQGEDLEHVRNEALKEIEANGMPAWKRKSGYHRRSKAENAMYRFKVIFGGSLRSRCYQNQKSEAFMKCRILNRMTELAKSQSQKVA